MCCLLALLVPALKFAALISGVLLLLATLLLLWALIDTAITSLLRRFDLGLYYLAQPLRRLTAAQGDALAVGLGLVLIVGIAALAAR